MIGFRNMTDKQFVIMEMSNAMSTYAIMDKAKIAPFQRDEAVRLHGESDVGKLEEIGWIAVEDGMIKVTDAGDEQLRSFL